MKKITLLFCISLCTNILFAQYEYEPSKKHPFGQANPEAPKQIKDYDELIGTCNCKSSKKGQDGKWEESVDMTWTFKYIMNGMAVQDETLKADGIHSGSIRQYDKDSLHWNVHYYATAGTPKTLQSWQGNRRGNEITLFSPSKAPNGIDGFYKITFSDISKTGFNWLGEWIEKKVDNKISFPLWKIECKKPKY